MGPTLSFNSHIRSITKSALFHLKTYQDYGPHFPTQKQKHLFRPQITSRLDYTKPRQHLPPTLRPLLWLQVKSHILYKLLLLTYKSLLELAPFIPHRPPAHLHPLPTSAVLWFRSLPRTKLKTFDNRAFSVAAPGTSSPLKSGLLTLWIFSKKHSKHIC